MKKIGFIGGGNMAQAIIAGIIKSNTTIEIIIHEPSEDQKIFLQKEFPNARFASNNKELFDLNCDVIILAVKPQILPLVIEEIKDDSAGKILISIAAGVTVAKIKSICPDSKVIRVMPNTPFLVMQGCGGISFDPEINQDEKRMVLNLFRSSGELIEVPEEKMHAITAISGSGPAYIFKIAENMIEAGVNLGLTESEAKMLTAQTIAGAGLLLKSSELSAEQLRINVTSPKGTTEAALKKMSEMNLDATIKGGIKEAYKKSIELAKG